MGDTTEAPETLLDVVDLRTYINTRQGTVKAVDGATFSVRRGETVGLVGESGSGKTMTCVSVMRLLPVASAEIVSGEVWFDGKNLLDASEAEMRQVRGRDIALIMQDALAALSPVLTVGDQIGEPLRHHLSYSKVDARSRVIEVLDAVRIPRPSERLNEYPHQFSGGMRQRIVAAMGLAMSPSLILADEPTTALDVTIQAQFIMLIRELQEQTGMSVLWVTHDLGVVAQTCDRVNVMYAGRIVESGEVRRILREPLHPYTRALMESVPTIGTRREKLYQIAGQPPDLRKLGTGCPFYERCPARMDVCKEEFPPAVEDGSGGYVHCWAVSR
jgi:oligopeptide/dipeptide ABC transporter ATP-binding protein